MKIIQRIMSAVLIFSAAQYLCLPCAYPSDALAPRSDLDPIEFKAGLVFKSIERACDEFAKPSLSAEEHRQVCETVRREFPDMTWFENPEGFEFALGHRYYFLKYRGGTLHLVSSPADYVFERWNTETSRAEKMRMVHFTHDNVMLMVKAFKDWKADQASIDITGTFIAAVHAMDGTGKKLPDNYTGAVLAEDGSAQGVFQMNLGKDDRRPPYLVVIETARGQTGTRAGRFKGIGMEMTYAAFRTALHKTRPGETDGETEIVLSSAHMAPRGRSYAVAVSRFYPDKFRFKFDGRPDWLYHPKRGVIRFMCYQLVRDHPNGVSIDDIWSLSGLKQFGYSRSYVKGVLDELVDEKRDDCRVVRQPAGGAELYYYPAYFTGTVAAVPSADKTDTVIIDTGRYPLDPNELFQIIPGADDENFRNALERVNMSVISRKIVTPEDLKIWNKMMCSRYGVLRPMLLRSFSYGVYRSFVQEWWIYWFLWDMNSALKRGVRGDPAAYAARMYKRFVDMQPFWDGNRRTALLVMYYILAKEGLIFQLGSDAAREELVDTLWNSDATEESIFRLLKQHVRPVWEQNFTHMRKPALDETSIADSAVGVSP